MEHQMPHIISWIVKDRVVLTDFHGVISADELKTFINTVLPLAKTGTPPVHHLSNSLKMERVEFSIATARNLIAAAGMVKEFTWQVDINTNRANHMVAYILSNLVNVRTRTFPTPEEAVAFLKDIDPTLAAAGWNLDLLS
jgi:hypothetical protein